MINKDGENLTKKTIIITFLLIFGTILITSQLGDAKFLDIWDSITGKAPTQTATVSITVGNNAPVIGNVTLDMADSITLTENGNKSFLFSFVAVDQEGVGNLVNNSAVANVSASGETTRYNNTFVNPTDGGCRAANPVGLNGVNYSCTINLVFYDAATTWTISVRINDSNGNFAQNITKTFTIAELTAIQLDQGTITFPSITPSQFNVSSSINITITNTGNDDISGSQATGETLNISAITLVPASGSTFIPASNFSIGQVNSTSGHLMNPCDTSIVANVTRLKNVTEATGYANFSGRINGSAVLAQAVGNKHSMSLCLLHSPANLASTTYSSSNSGAWTILAF